MQIDEFEQPEAEDVEARKHLETQLRDFLGIETADEEEEETSTEGENENEDVEETGGEETGETDDAGNEADAEADAEEKQEKDDVDPNAGDDEKAALTKRIEALTKLVESQALQTLQQPAQAAAKTSGDEGIKVPSTLTEFLGNIDLEEAQDDPQKLVELLSQVAAFAEQQTLAKLRDQIPTLVHERTSQAVNMQKLVDDFYRDNKELAEVRQTVSVVARNVGVEHPDWDMAKVLEESATRTRTMLGLKPMQKKTEPVKRSEKKPAFPSKPGAKTKVNAAKLSEMQRQINELL